MRIRLCSKLLLLVLLSTVGFLLHLQSETQASALPERYTFNEDERAAENLADERNISIDEARKRINWQENASSLADRLEKLLLKTDYGGVWIDGANDRINIGITRDSESLTSSRQTVVHEAEALDLSDGVDIIPVNYSYSTLMQTAKAISDLQKEYIDVKSEWPIQVGPRIEKNKVQVDIPKDESRISDGLKKLFLVINERYGDQIIYGTYAGRPVLQSSI